MRVRHVTSNKRSCPTPDISGRWRTEVGIDMDGKRVRFHIGTKGKDSEQEAMKRLTAIMDFYDVQCRELNINFWAGWCLSWAKLLSVNVPIIIDESRFAQNNQGQAAEELIMAQTLQKWGVPVIVSANLHTRGMAGINQIIDFGVQRTVNQLKLTHTPELIEEGLTIAPLESRETRTFHNSIESFIERLKETGKKNDAGQPTVHTIKLCELLEDLKGIHPDMPLYQIDVQKIVSHWQNRPMTKRGTRCSSKWAKEVIKLLMRLFRFIEENYNWKMPKGKIDTKVNGLKTDEHETAFNSIQKETYTPEQLATICGYTDQFGRMLIGLAVNTGFGAGEVGCLLTKNIHLYSAHPYADKLGIVSTDADSWVVGPRPSKTTVYSEHLLWSEVAAAVQPYMDGREVLPINRVGKPWYRPDSKNAQSGFGNWWSRIINNVVKDNPNFPKLPFGSLRDVLPNILRQKYGEEIASLCLHHVKSGQDDLINSYANKPYARLFSATRELHEMFKPMLTQIQQ